MDPRDEKSTICNTNGSNPSQGCEATVNLDYYTIFESAAVGMAILKEDFTMSKVNEASLRVLGLARHELEGSNAWLHYIHPNDLAILSNYHHERRKEPGSVPQHYEIAITDPFGQKRYLSISAAMLPDSTDSVVTFTDITGNKTLEKRMTYRIKLEEAVSKTSRLLISSRDYDSVPGVLQMLGEAIGLNSVFIYQFRDEGTKMDNTYEWCSDGTQSQREKFQNVNTALFPWLVQIIKNNQTYAIADAQEIQLGSTEEWLIIKSWGVRSLLCVPINNYTGDVIGFIGFMTLDNVQPWLTEDSLTMRIVAEMLGLYWERRKTEVLLQRYRMIFENARDIILLMEPDAVIIDANLEARNTYGYTLEELAKIIPTDLRPARLRPTSVPLPEDSNLAGILYETVHCSKDGAAFPVEIRSQVINISGKRYILSIIRDISERKKTEESLMSLNRALNNASNAVILTEPKGYRMLYLNQAFTDLLGYTLDELNTAGGFPVLYAHKEFAPDVYENLHEGNVWQGELDLLHKDGSVVQVQLYADRILNDTGRVLGLFGIITDIRGRKLQELALATEKERLAVTLHSIGDGVIATDTDGRILVINPVAEEIIGCEQEDIIGRRIIEIVSLSLSPNYQTDLPRGNALDLILKSGNETETLIQEAIMVDRQGVTKTVSLNSSPILDNDGKASGHVLVIRNITDLVKAQMQLALSQKLESIGELAAGIAHEINSPLQYIGDNTTFFQESVTQWMKLQKCYDDLVTAAEEVANLSEFVARVREVEEEIEIDYLLGEMPRALEQSLEGIQRVRKLVLAMKEFSHPGTKEKKLSDLNQGIEATIAISRNEWKYVAELKTDLARELPLIDCVIDEINQVILNIVVNAAQAIEEAIERGIYSKGLIKISTRLVEEYAEIIIFDNGPGIPKSVIAKIYDPFYTTKPVGKGTGQGLAIAHDIVVNKHQGTIDVFSEEGQGTTFVIRVPANSRHNEQEGLL